MQGIYETLNWYLNTGPSASRLQGLETGPTGQGNLTTSYSNSNKHVESVTAVQCSEFTKL